MQNPGFEQTVCKRYNFADRPSGVPHLSEKTEKTNVKRSGKTPFITNYRENSQVLFLLTADPVLLGHQKHPPKIPSVDCWPNFCRVRKQSYHI